MTDDHYESPVAGMEPLALAKNLRASMDAVVDIMPPKTAILILVGAFGPAVGIGYIANGEREGMVKMVRAWLQEEARRS